MNPSKNEQLHRVSEAKMANIICSLKTFKTIDNYARHYITCQRRFIFPVKMTM